MKFLYPYNKWQILENMTIERGKKDPYIDCSNK